MSNLEQSVASLRRWSDEGCPFVVGRADIQADIREVLAEITRLTQLTKELLASWNLEGEEVARLTQERAGGADAFAIQGQELLREIRRAEQAEAEVIRLTQELETLKRKSKVDDIAFSSMNHTAVNAEEGRDALLADRAALREQIEALRRWDLFIPSGGFTPSLQPLLSGEYVKFSAVLALLPRQEPT